MMAELLVDLEEIVGARWAELLLKTIKANNYHVRIKTYRKKTVSFNEQDGKWIVQLVL
jgi:hypothetical protein